MSNVPDSGPSAEQIHAAFSAVFKEITPTREAKVSAAERLEPFRGDVVRLRKQGYSWKQIANGMHDPRIGIKTAGSTLKLLFGTRQEKEELKKHVKQVARMRAMLGTIQLPPAPASSAAVPVAPTQTKPSLPASAYRTQSASASTATGLPPMPW